MEGERERKKTGRNGAAERGGCVSGETTSFIRREK